MTRGEIIGGTRRVNDVRFRIDFNVLCSEQQEGGDPVTFCAYDYRKCAVKRWEIGGAASL